MPEGGEPSFYYKLNNEEIKSMCPPVNMCILNHRPSPTLHPLVITIIILKMDRISKNVQKNANNECKNGLKKNWENRRCNQDWTIQRHRQRWTHKTQDEDKQNTKTQYRKLKRGATRTPPKTGGEPGCLKRVRHASCKTPTVLLI